MNRREAIQRVAILMGGTVIGASLFLEGCQRSASKDIEMLFDPKSIDFLGDLAEAILPKTTTPGAKEAGVGSEIPVIVRDCYKLEEQQVFLTGTAGIDERAKKEFGRNFQQLDKKDQTAFVDILDKEAQDYDEKKAANELPHFSHSLNSLHSLHSLAQN